MSNRLNHLRRQAFERQAGRCYYCRLPIWTKDPEAFALSQAISLKSAKQLQCIPRQNGGTDAKANIVAACAYCNRRRHSRKIARLPEKHKAHVKARMAKKRWHSDAFHEISSRGFTPLVP